MLGLMMDQPLLICDADPARRAPPRRDRDRLAPVEGDIHRYTYRDAHARARRLANALKRLGVQRGRPRRHAGLERLPPLGALLRGLRQRRGPPHHQPAPAPRPDRLDRQPRRGPGAVLRPHASCRWSRSSRRRLKTRDRACDRRLERTAATRSCSRRRAIDFDWPAFDENTAVVPLLHLAAPPATRRARSTATARRCCTPTPRRCPTR